MFFRSIALAAFATVLMAAPAAAQPSTKTGPVPLLALQSKAVKNGRVPVIVEFAEPRVGAIPGLATQQALDRAMVAANRGRQAEILARVLGADPMLVRAGRGPAKLMDHFPMMVIQASAEDLSRLAADPMVVRITESKLRKPHLAQSTGLLRMTGSTGAWARKATGAGRAVAVVDTGVNGGHEFLRYKVVSEACYSTTYTGAVSTTSLCPAGVQASTSAGSGRDCATSITGCGHGTHVAGIAAGNNRGYGSGEPRYGVARAAGVVAIKVFSRVDDPSFCGDPAPCVGAYDGDTVKALDRVYALRGGVANRKIDAVNLSLGGAPYSTGLCDSDPRGAAIRRLRNVGIATIVSSGNDGLTNAITSPACVGAAITVGATTKRSSTKGERIASYSNMSPVVDVLAPGGDFGYPFNSSQDRIRSSFGGGYKNMAGTSMAAPHVAGAFAAIRSKAACRGKSVYQIEKALETTGKAIKDNRPGGTITRRRIDVAAALKYLGC